jgi:hypothetical protein
MKSIVKLAAVALMATSLIPLNAGGASLLGGLVKTGTDSGNPDAVLSIGSGSGGTSIGVLGTNGVSVNLPTSGSGSGSGGSLPLNLGSTTIGLPGIATVSTTTPSGGGTQIGVDLLGGGGPSVGVGLPGIGVDVGLPGGGSGGGGGGNGSGGGNGGNGGNGGGTGGGLVINYYGPGANGGGGSSASGGSFAIPSGISSRLKALLRILAERDYLRVSNGRAVCLNSFGVAQVAGWVPQKDWGALQQALAGYSQDIYTLRQLLANCRSAGQRQALNLTDLNRVIAIDIDQSGQPVLFML